MFFGSNTNQSQSNTNNQLNQNIGYGSVGNAGSADLFGSSQQAAFQGFNTPLGGFDSNEDFGSQLLSQYGASYVNTSMMYNVADGVSETPSDGSDILYKPGHRDTPDDHVHTNTFEDTTIVNISYKYDLNTDGYRWDFYKSHKKEIADIQREIRQMSAGNDLSSTRGNTRAGATALQSSGFGATGLGQSTSLFGQTSTGTGFGQTSSSLFGQPTTSTGFGQTSTSLFGQPTSTTGFGQTSTTTGFGQTGSSLFGQPTTTTGFGQTSTTLGQPTSTGFGQPSATTAFGQSGSGLFGQSTTSTGIGQTSTNLFGQPSSTTAFGQSGINTGFGQTSTSLFGQPSSTTGLGQSTSLFGQTSTTTGFGQTSSSLFGQPSTGTAFGQTSISTPGLGQTSTTTGFGQTGSSLFGQPSTSTAFSQTNLNTTAFGQPSTTTGFGQTNSLFGQTNATSAFGQTGLSSTSALTQPNVTSTGFGQTTTTSAFGQPSSNLFGQTTANTGLGQGTTMGFSQPGLNTGFGQTNLSTAFGVQTAGNTSFGQTSFTNTAFGQPSINTGFGQASLNTALGQPGSSSSLLQPNSAVLGQQSLGTAFGQPGVLNTAFGQQNVNTGSAQQPSSNNLNLHRASPNSFPFFVQTNGGLGEEFVTPDIKRYSSGRVSFLGSVSEIESMQKPNIQLLTNWASNQEGTSVTVNNNFGSQNGSGATANGLNHQGSLNVQARLQYPEDLQSPRNTKTLVEEVRAELLIFDRHMMEGKLDREREFKRIMRSFNADKYYCNRPLSEKSKKQVTHEEEGEENREKLYTLKAPYGQTANDYMLKAFNTGATEARSVENGDYEEMEGDEYDPLFMYAKALKEGKTFGFGYLGQGGNGDIEDLILKQLEEKREQRRREIEQSYSKTYEEALIRAEAKIKEDKNYFEPDSTWNWDDPLSNLTNNKEYLGDRETEKEKAAEKKVVYVNKNAPKLTKQGYTTKPSIAALKAMTDEELKEVKDFQISREGYGDIVFPGATDLRGVDLDEAVDIGFARVSVYAGAEKAPEVGKGLNRRAYVSINNCTHDENGRKRYASELAHKYMLKKYCQLIGCGYLGVNFDAGTWMVETPFFVGDENGVARSGTIQYPDQESHANLVD